MSDSRRLPDDPQINSYNQDSGLCGNCLEHLDDGCNCTEQEREEGPTLQEREENYYADLGEARFKEEYD